MSVSESLICQQCGERVPGDYVVCPYCGYSLIQILRERMKTKVGFIEPFKRIWGLLRYPQRTSQKLDQIASNYDRKGGLYTSYFISAIFVTLTVFAYFIHLQPPNVGGWNDVVNILFLIVLPIMSISFVPLVFVAWVCLSLLLWLSAKLLGGKGSFKETMSYVGYSLVPFIPGFFVSGIVRIILMPNEPIGTSSPDSATIQVALDSLASSGANTFALIVLLPFAAWSIYIAAHGTEKVHRIKLRDSGILAASLVLLFFFAFYIL